MEIILASGSPRRKELLGLICPDFRVEVSGADEHVTEALSPEQLARLMDRLEPAVFFSGELCARYFTYMSRETGAHFVLFDDEDTLRCKLEVARSLSIHTFLAPWAEVADCAAGLGIRHSSPVAGRATSSAR